jgi:hypothetical protein
VIAWNTSGWTYAASTNQVAPSSLKLLTRCFAGIRNRLDAMSIYPMFLYGSGKQMICPPSVLGNLLSKQANGLHEARPYKNSLLPDQLNSSLGKAND